MTKNLLIYQERITMSEIKMSINGSMASNVKSRKFSLLKPRLLGRQHYGLIGKEKNTLTVIPYVSLLRGF
jgi:hypothetical protein